MYRLIPVDNDTQFLIRILQPVADLSGTFHTLHNGSHFLRNAPQGIQLTSTHLDGNPAPSHGAHIHAGGIDGNLRVQPLRLLPDARRNLLIAHGFVFFCHHIDCGGIGAAAPAAQKGHIGTAGHGAYILHILYGKNRLHHLVGQLPCLLQRGILRQLHIHCQLCGIHIRHKGNAVGKGKRNTAHQQHHHKNNHQRLHLQRQGKQLFISFA